MKFGLIGAGKIGKKFCDAMLLVEGASVEAVASATSGKAKLFAEEKNIPNYYGSYEEMLKSADIDCVYICTTHNFHYENLLLCIKHKKHIICEKAFVLNKSHAEEIFAKAKENNLYVMEAMWTRFIPAIQKVKSWINHDKIGEINLANYNIGFNAGNDHDSRILNPALAGGALYDIGVYAIEIMTYLIGQDLKDVKSMIRADSLGRVDAVDCLLMRFSNCILNLNCTIANTVLQHGNIYGTKGRIYFENPHSTNSCTLYCDDGTIETFNSPLENGFEFQIRNMIARIKDNHLESDIIPHKDTLQCAEIFDKVFTENAGVL